MEQITCKNCSARNPSYGLICIKCKAYLRERVVNIDLWNTISLLIESPLKAFRLIIYAEHKNFISLILFLTSIKLLISTMLMSLVTSGGEDPFIHFGRNYFIIATVLLGIICLFSLFLKTLRSTETRFKDNFSVLSYSLLPHIFGIMILFPVEMVIFGGFLFSNNPSPFILKETIAYILLGFEGLLILWQILLTAIAFYTQSGIIAFSIIMTVIFNALLYYILYLFSYLIF